MARVFQRPTWAKQDKRITRLIEEEFYEDAHWRTFRRRWDDVDYTVPDDAATALSLVQGKTASWVDTMRGFFLYLEDKFPNHNVYTDYDARVRLWFKYASGRKTLNPSKRIRLASEHAQAVAYHGLLNSFCTGSLAMRFADRCNLYDTMEAYAQGWSGMIDLADAFRTGVSVDKPAKLLNAAIRTFEELNYDDLDMKNCALKREGMFDHIYYLGAYIVCVIDREVYILGPASREQIADVLYTTAMWPVIPRMETKGSTKDAETAHAALQYLIQAVRTRLSRGKSCDSLAKQIKTCYSAVLTRLGRDKMNAEQRNLSYRQEAELLANANEEARGESLFFDHMLRFKVESVLNWGTVWNCLPAPDADPKVVNEAVKAKYNAPRNHNPDVWSAFIRYAMSSITAHWVLENRRSIRPEYILCNDGSSLRDHEWAMRCHEGVLTYPESDEERVWMVKVIPWSRTIENWAMDAEDVTHVNADIEAFNPGDIPVGSELDYCLRRGNIFSDKFTVQEVRDGFRKGALPGDRVLYLAAKSENTKYHDNIRETMSADDVLRAVLSEIDENISKLGSVIYGCAMRASPSYLEHKMTDILTSQGSIKISLDVSGWSPNMDRKGEMAFIDALMSMFDIPDLQRASNVFRDIWVVTHRLGYFDKWMSENGSVQGFFGTSDTILHILMAQWALSRMKDNMIIEPNAVVKIVSLIDDIVICCPIKSGNVEQVIDAFTETYGILGFTVEKTKTIASSRAFNFLNRIYYANKEVLTYGKIACKADREWERSWVTFHDEIDSIMNSFLGAVNRGLNPALGYYLAICRILQRAALLTGGLREHPGDLQIYGAWLPRNMGGWGLPTAARWITRDSEDTLSAGICAIDVIRRHFGSRNQLLNDHIIGCYHYLYNSELDVRDPWGYLLNPTTVTFKLDPSPSSYIKQEIIRTLARIEMSPLFSDLINLTTSGRYRDEVIRAIKTYRYPVEAAVSFISSLPHTQADKIMSKLAYCNLLGKRIPFKRRMKMRAEFRRLNSRLVNAWWRDPTIPQRSDLTITRAFDLVKALREKQEKAIGIALSGIDKVPVLELLAYDPQDLGHFIRAYVPGHVDLEAVSDQCAIRRSIHMPSPIIFKSDPPAERNIVTRCFKTAARVTALLEANEIDPRPFRKLWEGIWGATRGRIHWPRSDIQHVSWARIGTTSAHHNFSVNACPNLSGLISVKISGFLAAVEKITINIPYTSVIFTVKAINALDCALGFNGGLAFSRSYNLRFLYDAIRDPEEANMDIKYEPILSGIRPALPTHIVEASVDRLMTEDSDQDNLADVRLYALETLNLTPAQVAMSVPRHTLAAFQRSFGLNWFQMHHRTREELRSIVEEYQEAVTGTALVTSADVRQLGTPYSRLESRVGRLRALIIDKAFNGSPRERELFEPFVDLTKTLSKSRLKAVAKWWGDNGGAYEPERNDLLWEYWRSLVSRDLECVAHSIRKIHGSMFSYEGMHKLREFYIMVAEKKHRMYVEIAQNTDMNPDKRTRSMMHLRVVEMIYAEVARINVWNSASMLKICSESVKRAIYDYYRRVLTLPDLSEISINEIVYYTQTRGIHMNAAIARFVDGVITSMRLNRATSVDAVRHGARTALEYCIKYMYYDYASIDVGRAEVEAMEEVARSRREAREIVDTQHSRFLADLSDEEGEDIQVIQDTPDPLTQREIAALQSIGVEIPSDINPMMLEMLRDQAKSILASSARAPEVEQRPPPEPRGHR